MIRHSVWLLPMLWIGGIFVAFLPISAQLRSERPVDTTFHQLRRMALRESLPAHSVAVFFANPVQRRSNTVFYPYHPQRDLFYLTGFTEPHSVYLLFKDPQYDPTTDTHYHEVLFTQSPDARAELYDGPRLRPDVARRRLGIQHAKPIETLATLPIRWKKLHILINEVPEPIQALNHPYPLRDILHTFNGLMTKKHALRGELPMLSLDNVDVLTLRPIMTGLREVKTLEEIAWLRYAIAISCQAQKEVMHAIRPNISEREVQGIHEFVYKKYGIAHTGYPAIIGGGHNGCVLHYIANNRGHLQADELVLMDVGAEYYGYTADITRTIPVNGLYTPAQLALYDLVYGAQEAVLRNCKPGASFSDNTPIALRHLYEGLLALGILPAGATIEDTQQYAPHGVTHHIGLDVHDPGHYTTMTEGMVFTVEPGVYIPKNSPTDPKWWDIAIRIEDNILITKTGYALLSGGLPRSSADIMAVMQDTTSVLRSFTLPTLVSPISDE